MTIDVKRVIFLNGPPGSGKDLSAVILRNMLDLKFPENGQSMFRVELCKFAAPLKHAAHNLLGIPFSTEHYEKENGHDWKNKPTHLFFDHTPRSVYISLSEEYAKKQFGSDIFGRVAVRHINTVKQKNTFIFSDSGFAEEVIPVISAVGISNVLLIELERPGKTFAEDSRGYIGATLSQHFAGKLRTVRIPNIHDQTFLTVLLKGAMMKYFALKTEL